MINRKTLIALAVATVVALSIAPLVRSRASS